MDADDNDAYNFQYYNLSTQQWDLFYTAPIVSEGMGIVERQPYTLPSSITTDAVRVYGGESNDNLCFDRTCGQGGYALAQVELFGTPSGPPVPEPGSLALVGTGLIGLIGVGRFRRSGPA